MNVLSAAEPNDMHIRRTWFPAAFVAAAVVLFILIAGWLYYRSEQNLVFREQTEQLNSIADLKVGQIVRWRSERIGDGMQLRDNAAVARQVSDYFAGRVPGKELTHWIQTLCVQSGYSSAILLDPNATVRFSFEPHQSALGYRSPVQNEPTMNNENAVAA